MYWSEMIENREKYEKNGKVEGQIYFLFGWEKKKEKIENIVCKNSLSYPLR